MGYRFEQAAKIGAEVLEMRGILEQANRHRWRWYQGGWSYPLFTADGKYPNPEALRFKRFTALPGLSKYSWIKGKLHASDYYFEPQTSIHNEVRAQNGVLYVANGEPSALSFRSANIHNVVCWFGEANVPRTFVSDCRDWGVTKVLNYPDRDDTGLRASRKLFDLLQDTGIEYQAYTIEDPHGSKKDINDLWTAVGCSGDAFQKSLRSLSELDHGCIPPPPRWSPLSDFELLDRSDFLEKDRQLHRCFTAEEWQQRRLLAKKVEAALGVESLAYNHNGWASAPVECLLRHHEHDNIRPAAYWNQEGCLLWCFKCAQTVHLESCARLLHIPVGGD
eukprot:GGOE01061535.1.p1 GENE.GGOE01061535.1~~GGOE01061535.1.p1  ORF type:complete len:347 (+),score=105.85 GGOE01061535.1:41-1042(+)